MLTGDRDAGFDVALIAHGSLALQKDCDASADLTRREIEVNFVSTASLLILVANHFERQGRGVIAAISSVASDRGRASNYTYGAAKAALNAFLSGLRNRLHRRGVHVLTIKPGFVDTPMTATFTKGPLWASPGTVAKESSARSPAGRTWSTFRDSGG